jgi:hypothetical protein
MPWDPGPFWIGGGAVHSDAVVRLMADYAANDNEGILRSTDLKVTAFGTPGAGVNISPGACSMLARGAGQTNELYIARMASLDTVGIAPTGAGAGRSDLIIGRVEDPNVSGSPWPAPPSVAAGPYVYTRVVSGVPAGTRSVLDLNLGYSAVTLARIDLPASTATVLPAHVVDLRKLASPKRDRRLYTVNPSVAVSLTSATMAAWFGSWAVDVPTWATRVVIALTIGGIRHSRSSTTVAGTANGAVRAAFGTIATQQASYDVETTPANIVARYMIGAADTLSVPSAMRGTTQTLTIQGSRVGGNVAVQADSSTFAWADVEFQEIPV